MSFFEKSLNTLELPAVLEMLAREAVSDPLRTRPRCAAAWRRRARRAR